MGTRFSLNLKWETIINIKLKEFKIVQSMYKYQKLAIYQNSTIWFFRKII